MSQEHVLVIATLHEIMVHPQNVVEEVIQNVRTILTTIRGTVPLHRNFGISAKVIDSPLPEAKAILIKEIHQQIAKYEPRAVVIRAYLHEDYGGGADGRLYPAVALQINKTGVRNE